MAREGPRYWLEIFAEINRCATRRSRGQRNSTQLLQDCDRNQKHLIEPQSVNRRFPSTLYAVRYLQQQIRRQHHRASRRWSFYNPHTKSSRRALREFRPWSCAELRAELPSDEALASLHALLCFFLAVSTVGLHFAGEFLSHMLYLIGPE